MATKKQLTAIALCFVLVFASMLCGCEQKKHVQKVQPVLRLDLVKVIPPDLKDLSNVVYSWELTGEEKIGCLSFIAFPMQITLLRDPYITTKRMKAEKK